MAPNYPLRRIVALSGVLVVGWGAYLGITGVAGVLAPAFAGTVAPAPAPSAPSTGGAPSAAHSTPPATAKPTPQASTAKAKPQASTAARDTPFEVNGIVVVSKFHPLTKAYVPATGSDPDGLRPEVRTAVTEMIAAAKAEKLTLAVRSGYRSYSVQSASFKRAYAKYGEGARRYYAEAGHSEHQTGLALDLSDGRNQTGSSFAKTPQATWVARNAHRFGFIVRYPEGKRAVTGVDHEPWHVRYVGIDVATEMAKTPGLTLEEFLGLA